MKLIKEFCPYCMNEMDVQVQDHNETITVRSDEIQVTSKVLKCTACLKIFNSNQYPNQALSFAYREYSKKHKLLTSDEVSKFRHELRLTLREMSLLTGINPTTWSYYESGALIDPTDSHNIRLILTKKGMKIHLKSKPLPLDLIYKVEKWL